MTIDPTRKEWQDAWTRTARLVNSFGIGDPTVAADVNVVTNALTEVALGCPCPPEPAPEPFRLDAYTLVRIASPYLDKIAVPRHLLTADEAYAMSEALRAHADYARRQGEPEVCGHQIRATVDSVPVDCQRPKGHAGLCDPHRAAGDDDR